MATFSATLQVRYDSGFKSLASFGGDGFSASDGESDSQFTEGEEVTVTIFAGFVFFSGTFAGTAVIGGKVFIAVVDGSVTNFFGPQEVPSDVLPPTLSAITLDTNPFTVCFARGTRIATPHGERAVEALSIGDLVLTAEGASTAVKWIGRQTVHKLFTPDLSFRPVRLHAGALAENVPCRDLVVTADHGLLLDDVLVQAGALVNGTTIERVASSELGEMVTYYHLETASHDVILAEGVPAETFVDNVTRRRFDNYAEYAALYGDAAASIAEMDAPRVKSARQLPQALRERLAARTETLRPVVSSAA